MIFRVFADLMRSPALLLIDTPRDVSCARALGAKSVAVATGAASRDALGASLPDLLLEDFSDTEASVLRFWELFLD